MKRLASIMQGADQETTRSMPLLRVFIDRKEYQSSGRSELVLQNLTLELFEGEVLAVLGPSGSGKTTLLRLIAGLDTHFDGRISLAEEEVHGPGRDRGLVFQESRLLPWLRVDKNVAFALHPDVPRAQRNTRVAKVLGKVGLAEYQRAWPLHLSGGQEKRVALARALVNDPRLLLFDEPLTGCDEPTKFGLQDEIAALRQREARLTAILVTHHVDEAVYLSDRVALLSGKPANVARILPVPLPFPRDRSSRAFREICSDVTDAVFMNSLATLKRREI